VDHDGVHPRIVALHNSLKTTLDEVPSDVLRRLKRKGKKALFLAGRMADFPIGKNPMACVKACTGEGMLVSTCVPMCTKKVDKYANVKTDSDPPEDD